MRTRKKSEEMQAIKRRLLDDFLQVKQRSSLFGAGLIKTPALYREWEECIARRFRQFVELAKRLSAANPRRWAEAATLEVLQPFLEEKDPELEQVVSRVFDKELLKANAIEPMTSQSTRVTKPSARKLTSGQQAMAAMTELWRANPKASYKQILELADQSKMPTPWPDCATWSLAAAQKEGGVRTLLAKARGMSKKKSC
jgi:hypothetical protein